MQNPSTHSHSIKGPTIRMIFEYEGNDIKLVSSQRVDMKIPRPIMHDFEKTKMGFWVELENEKQDTICQCFIKDPLVKGVEVYSPDGTIEWKDDPNPKGHFVVLLPEIAQAKFVSMHRSTPAKAMKMAKAGPPKTLYRLELPK